MIEVYETKKIPRNCSTCLYQSQQWNKVCANANVSIEQAWKYAWVGGCPYYYLNHHKYRRVDRDR